MQHHAASPPPLGYETQRAADGSFNITPCSFCSCDTALWPQALDTWEGYLVAAAAGSTVQGAGSLARQLLRKRYVGITGSNKVVGALEVQQVSRALHTASLSFKGIHVTVMPVADRWLRDIASITNHRGCSARWYMPVAVINQHQCFTMPM